MAESALNADLEPGSAGDRYQVVLHVEPPNDVRPAAHHVLELADGGIEVKMTLSSLDEVERWILSWGGHAQAIKPKRLVEQVRAAAQKIVDGSR